jgi:hypothetical protein
MNRRMSIILPFLCAGVIGGIAGAIICKPFVFWAKSACSGKSFLIALADEPSEAEILDAVIQREPLIMDKSEAVYQWRRADADGVLLAIKTGGDRSVIVSPYKELDEYDAVALRCVVFVKRGLIDDAVLPPSGDMPAREYALQDGGRIKGVWLTEPGTRIQFPSILVRSAYSLVGVACGLAALLVTRWLWHFFLARTREFSGAVRGS